jgi:hypothetical protein
MDIKKLIYINEIFRKNKYYFIADYVTICDMILTIVTKTNNCFALDWNSMKKNILVQAKLVMRKCVDGSFYD